MKMLLSDVDSDQPAAVKFGFVFFVFLILIQKDQGCLFKCSVR